MINILNCTYHICAQWVCHMHCKSIVCAHNNHRYKERG